MDHIRDRMHKVNSPVNRDLRRSVKDNTFHDQNIGLNIAMLNLCYESTQC
jgi:hypothetical protein